MSAAETKGSRKVFLGFKRVETGLGFVDNECISALNGAMKSKFSIIL